MRTFPTVIRFAHLVGASASSEAALQRSCWKRNAAPSREWRCLGCDSFAGHIAQKLRQPMRSTPLAFLSVNRSGCPAVTGASQQTVRRCDLARLHAD